MHTFCSHMCEYPHCHSLDRLPGALADLSEGCLDLRCEEVWKRACEVHHMKGVVRGDMKGLIINEEMGGSSLREMGGDLTSA